MAYRALALLALYVLFNAFTCEECEIFFADDDGPELVVQREGTDSILAVGDTLWVSADFPARQSTDVRTYVISEGGGVILHRLFTVQPGTDTLRRLDSATVTHIDVIGDSLQETGPFSAFGTLMRFTCPDGTCGFRQGFRFRQPGTYLLQTEGSAIDDVSADFDFCGNPSFSTTRLEGGNQLSGVEQRDGPLVYASNQRVIELIPGDRSSLISVVVE